ncbi:MAG: bile acid:sodium symporter [Candidatus Obscuribacterales bacterium]|nr:bile acid:sodium symporter [Candidatus Obscuribacterales bacterium]
MTASMSDTVTKITHFIHKYFLPLLLVSYVLAGIMPAPGLALRQLSLGTVSLPGLGQTNLSISLLMLSFLLFNAGLGIQTKELIGLRKRPLILAAGFLGNILVPILLVMSFHGLLGRWHNADELQNMLVGFALIAAMPIAGSSAAWAQNANGNISLSLGLVLSSTILSPLTTPLVLNFYGLLTHGDYSEDLQELAQQGTNTFLCLTVVIPSLLGIATHMLLGESRTAKLKPFLKLVNFIFLLLLNYSNACTSLPEVFSKPDWDLLALILVSTSIVCSVAFFSGWLISRLFKTDVSDRAALMFSLGMNNNGTGMVLASAALADHPAVLVPMIFYTLVQQVIAAIVDAKFFDKGKD